MSTLLYGGHSDDAAARAMDAARTATPEQVIAGLREEVAEQRARMEKLLTALAALPLLCERPVLVWRFPKRCGACPSCRANAALLEVVP